MKIISNGKEKEIIVLTYFKLGSSKYLNGNEKEYILYTVSQNTNERLIYLARVKRMELVANLMLPSSEELLILKEILECMLKDDMDLSILRKQSFEYIEIKELEELRINELKFKTISMSKDKYIKLISNKYLTYPKLEILNIDEITKEGYDKNNNDAISACILSLVIYFIGIIIFQIIQSFRGIPINSIFKLNGPSVMLWSLVIALISMTAYNFEEKSPFESFIFSYIISFVFLILLSIIQNQMNISKTAIISFIYNIIFIVPYVLAKKISFKIINKIKARNYLTYYCIYLIPFAVTFFITYKIFNTYLSTTISDLIARL